MIHKILLFVLLIGAMTGSALAENATLKIITEPWAPFSYKENGKVKGVITDVVRNVFQSMDVSVTFQVVPWKRAVAMLKKGKGDALYSASYKTERAKFLIYPKHPIYQVKYLFYSKKGSGFNFDGNVDHLRGKIGAMRGYSYTKAFWNTPKTCADCYKIEIVNKLEQNFKKLHKGEITAFPASQKVAEAMMKKEGYTNEFEASLIPLATKDYFLTFRKGIDPMLVDKFDQAIAKIKSGSRSVLAKH
ncbi:MAG: transporter substrate-binding domain-containing protein [Mariprofundaceae bacterium]|nr:transporter substrate-binding domain-containing protein [Mariprofundaceae bacterium]